MRRLGEDAANALIVVEGVYSMLGDRAPLREFVSVKQEFGAPCWWTKPTPWACWVKKAGAWRRKPACWLTSTTSLVPSARAWAIPEVSASATR